MKISEQWLREWVNPSLNSKELSEKLTLSGLEIESVSPVAEISLAKVVVAEVEAIQKHPTKEGLHICTVNIGHPNRLTIVCGASNVKPHKRFPAALEGAILPAGKTITRAEIQGVTSEGMLCSLSELGLAEENEELFELPSDTVLGQSLEEVLQLKDNIFDIAITPNRGDCLSILGLAKEIAA